MAKKPNILYCSYSKIPSNMANSIAVIKQCAKLDKIANLKAILIKGDTDELYTDIYDVQNIEIILLPKFMLKWNSLGLGLFCAIYALIHKFDMIYSRDLFINNILNKFGIDNIYEMHQLDQLENDFDATYKKVFSKITNCRHTKRIVCISNTLKQECLEFGVEEKKLNVLHSGVDINSVKKAISPPCDASFTNDNPLIVYTGSIAAGKGVDVIINMSNMTNDYNFLIIGGNSGDIQEKSNLKQIPWLPQKFIGYFLGKADYLIMPLVEQRYKFNSPLKLFEYLASGKISVASDIECVREIITHKENGLLARPNDAGSFIDQINYISKNTELKKKIETNAQNMAKQYSWENRANQIVNLIGEIKNEKNIIG